MCDNLKAGVAKPLWFEPTLNATFAALAEHYDTTVLPTRPRKPRDKAKVEVGVQVVERWILARLRNWRFFSLGQLNAAIRVLLDELNDRPLRHLGQSRRQMFEAIERAALAYMRGSRTWCDLNVLVNRDASWPSIRGRDRWLLTWLFLLRCRGRPGGIFGSATGGGFRDVWDRN